MFSRVNTVYSNFNVSKSRLKVSDCSWCLVFRFNVFFGQKIVAIFGRNKNNKASCSCDPVVTTTPYIYSSYSLKKKKEFTIKVNSINFIYFFNNRKSYKKFKKSSLVQTLLDYNVLL